MGINARKNPGNRGFALLMKYTMGMSEQALDKYRMSSLVPLMPDFYVGDPAQLETYVEGARKMQGLVGAFTSKFGLK